MQCQGPREPPLQPRLLLLLLLLQWLVLLLLPLRRLQRQPPLLLLQLPRPCPSIVLAALLPLALLHWQQLALGSLQRASSHAACFLPCPPSHLLVAVAVAALLAQLGAAAVPLLLLLHCHLLAVS